MQNLGHGGLQCISEEIVLVLISWSSQSCTEALLAMAATTFGAACHEGNVHVMG